MTEEMHGVLSAQIVDDVAARDREPGAGHRIFERLESEVRSYCRSFPVRFDRASGAVLHTVDGRSYLDFLSGCSSLNYGHNDPDLKAALIGYVMRDGIAHSLDMFTEAKAAFLEEFERTILRPRGLDYRVQFTGPTGANAVEAALKLARKVTGRHNVIAFTNGFHGVTLGALAATGNGYNRDASGLPLPGVTRMPYDGYFGDSVDTADYIGRMLDDPSGGIDAPAAVIVETVQGEGGLNVASFEWLRRIADMCRRHGAMLIVDEIQAGCGRTGRFFSFEEAGVVPDIVTMAKSLSGMGLPLSLVLIGPEHDQWRPGEHNGTFRGNCHAFVTARAAIAKFWRDDAFHDELSRKCGILSRRLHAIAAGQPAGAVTVKGRGMMMGLDVGSGEAAAQIVAACFADGVVLETSGNRDQVVKVLAPLTIDDAQLAAGLDILGFAVANVFGPHAVAAQ